MSDGKLTGGEVDIIADAGAFADHVVGTASHALSSSEGVYRFPSWKVRSRAVYTNNPDYGCMRGYGSIQALFALETHLDALAREISIDPAELRLANLVEDGDVLITKAPLHDVHIRETMETALARSGYWDKKGAMGPNRGIGIAIIVNTVGLLSSSANVSLGEDGTIAITTAAVEIGTGAHTVLSQIAAEVLGVPIGQVSVAAPDSDTIVVSYGRAYDVSDPKCGMTLETVAGASIYGSGGPLIGVGSWHASRHHDEPVGGGSAEGIYPTFGFGTHVAEVEIDPDTGQVTILDYTACHDVGKAINPVALEGQIEGAIAQGLGGGLWEEILVSDGRILNPSFTDYRIPTIMDVPRMRISLVEVPDALGPFGAKGIGEHPILGPGPSVANAISDAANISINRIPVTAERLAKGMDAVNEV